MQKMKDSGVEWIGEIPEEWKLKKIKYTLKSRNEKNNPIISKNILSLTAKLGVIPIEEKEGGGNKPKEDYSAYKLAYPGDIVMNSMNILSGSVGLSKYFGCVSPVYYMLNPFSKDDDVRYFNYIFQTTVFQKSLLGLGNGILMKESDNGKLNTIRMRIPLDKLGNLYIPVPESSIQKKIASFLDSKCSAIDELYSDIQKQIETLEEYKKSVITEAVTKGLNPNVEMKESGIEWISQIPEEWKVNKIKYLFKSGKGLSITKENLIDEGLPVISYGQIHSKFNNGVTINNDLLRFVDFNYQKKSPQCQVYKYDFIFADTSEDYDGCGNCIYKRDDSLLFAGYHSIILHSIVQQDNRYFAYLFKTDCWRKQLREIASGVKVFSIAQKTLINSSLIIPSYNEQQNIANYLDEKCEEIDKAIKEKKEQLEILEQYKKSLIYEYVTGKKEVPAQ